ncbi:SagB/ThcOx family dehydrogenase [Heyndrickxia sp. FSL W8-0423]|uniref:SagB/ThcOx family dehydrogenase n=1 Tax=Heyndrickxia sp. FSL W8-0423 TaxID=2921601 RepID=UPI0030F906BF
MKTEKWLPTTKFSIKNQDVIVTTPIIGKKYKFSKSEFKKAISQRNEEDLYKNSMWTQTNSIDEKTLLGVNHWINRGWTPSLDYYLSSRGINYLDKGDSSGELRRKIIKKLGVKPPRHLPNKILETIKLETPHHSISDEEFLSGIWNRRSVRRFNIDEVVTLEQLAFILNEGTRKIKNTRILEEKLNNPLLSYGSAFEFYITVFSVQGLQHGIYKYDLLNEELLLLEKVQLNEKLSPMMSNQGFTKTACFSVFLIADFEQYQWRYRHERALRNLYIETGRVMQDLIMSALELNVHGIITPALEDRKLRRLLGIDTYKLLPITSLTMGRK